MIIHIQLYYEYSGASRSVDGLSSTASTTARIIIMEALPIVAEGQPVCPFAKTVVAVDAASAGWWPNKLNLRATRCCGPCAACTSARMARGAASSTDRGAVSCANVYVYRRSLDHDVCDVDSVLYQKERRAGRVVCRGSGVSRIGRRGEWRQRASERARDGARARRWLDAGAKDGECVLERCA